MENDDMYRQYILDVFNNLKKKRKIDDADLVLDGVNPSCGDEIKIYIKIKGDKIEDISFTGDSCLLSQVSAELLFNEVIGKTKKEIEKLDLNMVFELLGFKPSMSRIKCVELPLNTIKKS